MSTVRTVVHPGWLAVSGPEVDAVVEAADRHAESLEAAAADGLVALLEALTAHGLASAPAFVACAPTPTGVRVVARGAGCFVLPDGTRIDARGRLPWLDVDLDLDAGDEGEVVLEGPEPQPARGWRRPARLSRAAAEGDGEGDGERPEVDPVVTPGAPERDKIDQLVEVVPPEVEADAEPEPDLAADETDAEPEPDAVAVAPQPDLTLPPPPDATGLPPAARVPASPAPRSGLIEAVPWRRGDRGPAPSPAESDQAPATPPVPVPTPTELLPVVDLDAPTHVVPEPGAEGDLDVPAAAPEHPTPDVTTNRDALPRSDDDLDRPVVLAVLCPAGHPSPPHAGSCRTCGREIPPQQPFPTPRPSLGVLRISTGGSVPLDRGVLLGRAPRVNEELPANQRPHLLRVGGPDRDISRNHAEIVLEGWHVLVRDLGSTNGTTVTLPGQEAVRLRPTEDQGIEPGTVVTLADEVVLTYEVQE
ncbi:MAG TPA: FHA domain-containing protein [Ornithinibacter sp.]|nr:FHA domain-containing protein [Ornithinibacter sp.]